MDYIKGFTFGWLCKRGEFLRKESRESLRLMKERTASNYVLFTLAALQDTAQSVAVDFTGEHMVSDAELVEMIGYARELGMKVIMKPLVNVRNGTWRAHINFFDEDTPGEPTWKEWFESYTRYQCHYAEIAEKMKCEMMIVGCEMVMSERREHEWRKVISEVRKHYSGPVSYNTDKYREDKVSWWDALDIISSSGYYPINNWETNLERIKKVIDRYDKPFFFAEAGCPSRKGSPLLPNNWIHGGDTDVVEQENYYRVMFEKTKDKEWIRGFGLWDWSAKLHREEDAVNDNGYGVFGKPAEKVIYEYYSKL